MQESNMISIVMPAYNAEKTIEKSICSVLEQSYDDYELIIVNDGSTDNTEVICRKIIDNNPERKIRIVSQNNMGLAEARNTGINYSEGCYICFIDSDDTVDNHYVEKLYNNLVENQSDLSVCGFNFIENDSVSRQSAFCRNETFSDFFKNIDFLNLLETGLINSACNKLYRKDVIVGNALRFKSIAIVEDFEFNLNYLLFSKSISVITDCLYNYLVCNSTLTKKVSQVMFDNYIDIHIKLYKIVDNNYHSIIDRFIYHQYMSIIIKYLNNVAKGAMQKTEVYPLLCKYIRNTYVCSSFKSYTPISLPERLIYMCVKNRLFLPVIMYFRIKQS